MRQGKETECLIARLGERGLTRDEARRLVRDALLITERANPGFDVVVRKLNLLGWDEDVMDRFSFEQVMFLCAE